MEDYFNSAGTFNYLETTRMFLDKFFSHDQWEESEYSDPKEYEFLLTYRNVSDLRESSVMMRSRTNVKTRTMTAKMEKEEEKKC